MITCPRPSIALRRVVHIGAVSRDGADDCVLEQMGEAGIDLRHIAHIDVPTGHAIVQVADSGENAITIYPGANEALTGEMIEGGWLRPRRASG